jgi:uncharacterized membrane protein (UPF0127 family)/CheY-like chemotaxis protein
MRGYQLVRIHFPRNAPCKQEKGHSTLAAKTKLIVNATRGKCLCVVVLADRPLRRMWGLIGQRGLPAGEGMLITPAPAIHTAFMRFPIDALFLDRNMRVLDIVERLRPWRVASKRRARAVLELSAGECARRGVEIGDRLELRERSANGALGPDEVDPGRAGVAGAHGGRGGELARLQPLRVLVLSPDRQFRTVVSLLLARRNCSVTSTANAARLPELIVRERADVAVIDASDAATGAAFATVQTLAQPIGLVLVADDLDGALHEAPVLPKWGPFRDLLAAIERAHASTSR